MLILITILTRVIKNEMKALLRGTMSKIKAPLQAPYRSILVRYLNWISGGKKQDNRQQNGQQQQQEQQQGQQQEQEQQKQQPKEKEKEKEKSSKFYWDRTLKKAMKKWFHTPLPFIDESFPLRDLMFSEESELILKFPPRQFLLFRLNQGFFLFFFFCFFVFLFFCFFVVFCFFVFLFFCFFCFFCFCFYLFFLYFFVVHFFFLCDIFFLFSFLSLLIK